MHWLPLTLICAFALASADAATKYWLSGASAREIVVVRLGLAGLLLIPFAGLDRLPGLPPPFWAWMALLIPLELLAMLLYMRAIRDHALSLTLPYLAFTPVFVTVTGWVVLGETVSLTGFIGILTVVAGSWLLNFESRERLDLGTLTAPFAALARQPGARLMLGVALIYAVTSVGGKAAMAWMDPIHFGAFYFVLVGLGSLMLIGLTGPRSLRVLGRRPRIELLIATLTAVMVVTHFLALARVETAYMITVKRTSLLFGILYGALLFGERHLGRHLLAGGLMVIGVALVLI